MRKPQWFRSEVENAGRQFLKGGLEVSEALDLLADAIADHAGDPFGRDVHIAFCAKEFRAWRDHQETKAREEEKTEVETGCHQEELVPGLPRCVEVSPNRFIDQPKLTGPDLDAAKRQLEVKKSNADGAWDRFMRFYSRYRPLLVDGKTLSDVIADIEGYGDAEGTV